MMPFMEEKETILYTPAVRQEPLTVAMKRFKNPWKITI